ncbi:MAG: chemotaxis protein CheW [Gammaproteobacteria bacterium]|nr:chemotaxis protein CheW [Gammaproteobacteria bacterium]
MIDKPNNSEAMKAIDHYLEVLLDADSKMACEERKSASIPLSGSKLYHIDSHPLHKKNNQLDSRHNLERVERLLDDFNSRNSEATAELTTDLKPSTQADSEQQKHLLKTDIQPDTPRVLFEPSLLQPKVQSDKVTEEEIDVADVRLNEAATTDPQITDPEKQPIQREDWSEQPFQTLLFDVAGLTLAVPLVKLGGIFKIEQKPTSLFGKPDWFIGLMPGHDGNINVIDTARWVMPEKYQQAQEAGLEYEFLILLADSNWGLACSSVHNALSVSPENMRWRPKKGKRPWLDGMIIDEMCALLNVDTLIHLLDENFPR